MGYDQEILTHSLGRSTSGQVRRKTCFIHQLNLIPALRQQSSDESLSEVEALTERCESIVDGRRTSVLRSAYGSILKFPSHRFETTTRCLNPSPSPSLLLTHYILSRSLTERLMACPRCNTRWQ